MGKTSRNQQKTRALRDPVPTLVPEYKVETLYSSTGTVPEWYNQLQKYLRHCTVFWDKWPVHDLVLVILPPTIIKLASNTRPCSKLGGTTLNGKEEGGQFYISQTCDQERFEARKVVFSWSVSTFLQLVIARVLQKRCVHIFAQRVLCFGTSAQEPSVNAT